MRPFAKAFRLIVRSLSLTFGGDEEDRTPDPLRARQVLSQLSYTPIFFEGCALKIEQHPLPESLH